MQASSRTGKSRTRRWTLLLGSEAASSGVLTPLYGPEKGASRSPNFSFLGLKRARSLLPPFLSCPADSWGRLRGHHKRGQEGRPPTAQRGRGRASTRAPGPQGAGSHLTLPTPHTWTRLRAAPPETRPGTAPGRPAPAPGSRRPRAPPRWDGLETPSQRKFEKRK